MLKINSVQHIKGLELHLEHSDSYVFSITVIKTVL
jgi:hypothetical protein